MLQSKRTQAVGHLGGVSLASFLQMLEQERKSCTLEVVSNNLSGRLFFDEGDLVDAECADVQGQEAVYHLLAFENPTFKVGKAENRLQRITQPLAYLLVNAATKLDEKMYEDGVENMTNDPKNSKAQLGSVVERMVDAIANISGVKHYYLLNRQGKVVMQSATNNTMGDFIAYCIVSGIQIRKSLGVMGMQRVQLDMENGEILLIMPGAGMIIGLLLAENVSVDEVAANLRTISVTT